MKAKTSITLSKDVLAGIDKLAGSKQSRSAFIDGVLREHLRERAMARRDAREIAIINRHASRLNRDAEDGLAYQAPLGERPED
jgi:metal-responsive CopG/Arc/MetJ family transcriptional regulator